MKILTKQKYFRFIFISFLLVANNTFATNPCFQVNAKNGLNLREPREIQFFPTVIARRYAHSIIRIFND
ncbi:MAG TPA: hypothetical protein PK079_11430 [Leptospiraceae bacterium]|nr:hypothetical protein [Leptospiraceae bacterium]HMX35533.1 hypothetical protein [Leptospiraceae bacterium]HMZ65898.1 hypothetical protein [Leptospiraceae bacterium]HNA06687.1 hypothetical protein [Leptospiraceae bacterium]HNE53776.1 hypothetical protein [Leptospiraceae bacterium]